MWRDCYKHWGRVFFFTSHWVEAGWSQLTIAVLRYTGSTSHTGLTIAMVTHWINITQADDGGGHTLDQHHTRLRQVDVAIGTHGYIYIYIKKWDTWIYIYIYIYIKKWDTCIASTGIIHVRYILSTHRKPPKKLLERPEAPP